MKLVDILAQELKEWPQGALVCVQDLDGEIKFGSRSDPEPDSLGIWFRGRGHEIISIGKHKISVDYSTAIVTRAQWQAAVEALRDPLPPIKNPLPMPNVVPPKQEAIDWSKAPEGATHAYLEQDGNPVKSHWIKLSGGCRSFAAPLEGWKRAWHSDPFPIDIAKCIAMPSAWNGQGLPPVDTVCEALWNEARDEWLKTKVFGVNEHGQPIHRWEEGPEKFGYQASPLISPLNGRSYFRPIRTPEQLAAEEREAAINEMVPNSPLLDKWLSRRVCEALYEAGYRKQVQS